MNVELKRIAEKKLEQLGGDVCGVLVRNEAGAWAAVLWDLAGDAPKQPAKQEWDGEGLPPVGVECRMTLGFVEYDHVKITYMGDGVFCYLNKRTELEYTGALCDATFRPLKTQHERQRDSLAELCRTKFNQQTSSSNPYLWRQIADAILSRYTLEPKP